jgi:nucleotide-binding universal stress UspA family protein
MYDRILLPTDGSDAGTRAVDQALGLAAETGATLHLLFVLEEIPYAPETMDDAVGSELREIGEATLETVRERADGAGVEVVEALREGAPHSTILEYAAEEDADVIVMGTHGRSGLDRYLLGSVTERVVRTADIPVLTVRMSGAG